MAWLFGKKKKRAHVTVQGLSRVQDAADGRYDKQRKRSLKQEEEKLKNLKPEPRSAGELAAYVEEKYHVKPLPHDDERFRKAYMGVKAYLVGKYAPEILETKELPRPDHPPVSEHDPDYEAWQANENARWKEAVMIPAEKFPMHLKVYSISLFTGETPVAWLEVYIESEHSYLAFEKITLEYEEHYLIDRTMKDIVGYFGVSEQDIEEMNDRYMQYVNIML